MTERTINYSAFLREAESLEKFGGHAVSLELLTIKPADWQGLPVPAREWAAQGVIPERNVTTLNGDGGLGKTLLALQLLASTVLGRPWLGIPTRQGPALGVFCEDEADELHRRIVDIASHYGCQLSDLNRLCLVPRVEGDNILVEFDKNGHARTTPLYHAILELAVRMGARTVVFDSQHDLFGGNEIIRTQARQFIGYLRHIAIAINGAVLLTAHPSIAGMTSGTGNSGSTAWNNAVRSRLYLTHAGDDGDDNTRVLKTMKSNYGPRGEEIEIQWEAGVFVRSATPGGDPFREAEAAFLDCLDKSNGEGRHVSASPHSATFAPKAFSRMPQARKCKEDKLRRAMDALFSAGKIKIGEHRKPNRHTIEVIMRADA